jgi:hypothetical protein
LDFSPPAAVVMTMIAVANAAKTKLNAVANVAATKLTKVTVRSNFTFTYNKFYKPMLFYSMGFFVSGQFVCKYSVMVMKFIQAFEPYDQTSGVSVTYSTTTGRKSFSLPRPETDSKSAPLAIESFAIDPEVYQQRMEMVEALIKKQTDQGR